jgi:hypothetical protein
VQLVLRQYDYWITVYRRTWRGSVITSFVLPFLFLAAMGIGLGGFVDEQADSGALGGLSYVAFIAPACSPRRPCRPPSGRRPGRSTAT